MKTKAYLAFVALALAYVASVLAGCRVITYAAPDGSSVTYVNVGFATQVDGLEVEKEQNRVTAKVTGYKSEAQQALDIAKTALEKVP